VEAQRAEDTDEHDSLGWTAFEEAQEPSDAMTIIGAPPPEEVGVAEDVVPEADPEPDPDPEPELPPAAEAEGDGRPPSSRGWWRRRQEEPEAKPEPEQDLPRHVRVLPADLQPPGSDPWETGFDGPEGVDESDEPELVEDERPRRFRRR
jgi:hypothetical protein